jgi:hypothetical protein
VVSLFYCFCSFANSDYYDWDFSYPNIPNKITIGFGMAAVGLIALLIYVRNDYNWTPQKIHSVDEEHEFQKQVLRELKSVNARLENLEKEVYNNTRYEKNEMDL